MEDLLKMSGAFASLFAIYKLVIDVILARSTRRRDEYSFTKGYLSDLANGGEHLYVLEKGFFALTGRIYSIDEIRFLLNQPSQSIAIDLRGDCGGFIFFKQESTTYEWRGKYASNFIRKYTSGALFTFYMITASLAITPIYLKGISSLGDFSVLIYSLSLIVTAISCLIHRTNFNNAKKFMDTVARRAQ